MPYRDGEGVMVSVMARGVAEAGLKARPMALKDRALNRPIGCDIERR